MVVIDMVGDRKIDQKYYDVKKAKAERQKNKKSNQEKTSAQGTSFKQTQSTKKEIICHCCGEKGHYANKCPKKGDIAPNKWAIKTGAVKTGSTNLQQGQNDNNDGNAGWAWNTFQHLVNQPDTGGGEFQGNQQQNGEMYDFLKDTIILDSCLLYTSPSPRDGATSRMPSSA